MRRADELDVALAADLGEVGVLREEAVAGVNRLDVRLFGGGDDAWNLEIALASGAGPMQIASSANASYGAPRSAVE